MSDNNGNLLKQQVYIPGHQMRWQQYDYDSLNRSNSAREVLDGGGSSGNSSSLTIAGAIAPSTPASPTAPASTIKPSLLAQRTIVWVCLAANQA